MSFVRRIPLTLSLVILAACGALAGTASVAAAKTQCGTASWYGHGSRTASGEKFNPDGLTAAHRSLPFGTVVTVKNLRNGRSVRVRINDRGPFVRGRIIDVSRGAARRLGLMGRGTARVRVSTGGGFGACS